MKRILAIYYLLRLNLTNNRPIISIPDQYKLICDLLKYNDKKAISTNISLNPKIKEVITDEEAMREAKSDREWDLM